MLASEHESRKSLAKREEPSAQVSFFHKKSVHTTDNPFYLQQHLVSLTRRTHLHDRNGSNIWMDCNRCAMIMSDFTKFKAQVRENRLGRKLIWHKLASARSILYKIQISRRFPRRTSEKTQTHSTYQKNSRSESRNFVTQPLANASA